MSRRADTRLNLITDKVDRRPRIRRSEGLGNRRKCPEIAQVLSEAARAERERFGRVKRCIDERGQAEEIQSEQAVLYTLQQSAKSYRVKGHAES